MTRSLFRKNAISILSIIILIGFTASASAEKAIEWTMVSPLTPGISYLSMYKEMCENISKKSDGRLRITFLSFGEHPYKGADIPKAVRDNLVQIGNTADVYISSLEPSISIMSVPFLYDSLDHAKRVYKEMLPGHFSPLLDSKYNSKVLTGFLVSGAAIHADAPLTSLEALQGRKIRVFNKDTGDMISMLGGTPVTVAFGELYTALQRGTINGCLTGMIGAKAAKVYEVVDHCTWWNWGYSYEFSMVNKEALGSLPVDLQKIVVAEGHATSQKIQTHQDRLPPEILVESMETYGIHAHGLPEKALKEFQEKTTPITKAWLKRAGADGNRAYEIYQRVKR